MFVLLHLHLLIMCKLRNGELYPLMNMKASCNYIGITLVKKVDKVVDRYLSEVNRCGEECLRLCSVNFGNVCTEGCRREWKGCKGIPQDQLGWIPKLTSWTG